MTYQRPRCAILGEVDDERRRIANWVNLTTPLGLAIAWMGRASVAPGPRGLRLATGYRLPFPVANAFTVGSVIITKNPASWWEGRERLLRHEERHANQYVACGGLPFFPLYVAAMVWSVLRTGNRASANVFEVRAGLADGGYRVPAGPAPSG